MNESTSAKQQIVDKIKASSTILVTVGTDPSVDELAAALGLTALLNNIKKHATAVVSGEIPPAIGFLDPERTFENTVDSLRDFIIALDKTKADHLRYKVDGDVVKIFITPYRTTITQNDLDFSQGDYNVELVLGLGVKDKNHLDKALSAHGRILHDATVATLSAGPEPSKLGAIDWHEPSASSVSEMLTSLSEALKGDKPLLDEQIATAFLTGIVAATDRFSNDKTSSKVMTMAAQLMAAGANQQLIAAKLQESHAISDDSDSDTNVDEETPSSNADGTLDLSEGESTKLAQDPEAVEEDTPALDEEVGPDGSLAVSHEKDGTLDQVAQQTAVEQQDEAARQAEAALAERLETVAPVATADTPSLDDLQKDIAAASADVDEAAAEAASAQAPDLEMPDYEPTLGGTLNATTEQAADDKRREEEGSRNRTILSHDEPVAPSAAAPQFAQTPFTASAVPGTPAGADDSVTSAVAASLAPLHDDVVADATLPLVAPDGNVAQSNAADGVSDDHADAQAAVEAAYNGVPFDPANHPLQAVGAQPLGGPVPVSDQPAPNVPQPPIAPEGLPPLPDFAMAPPPPPPLPLSTSGALPPEQLGQLFGPPSTPPPAEPQPSDPAQFKIPGQS